MEVEKLKAQAKFSESLMFLPDEARVSNKAEESNEFKDEEKSSTASMLSQKASIVVMFSIMETLKVNKIIIKT